MKCEFEQHQKGFSIVEIAIVLVIVGVLIGGVLQVQSLMANAKVKKVMKDLEGVSSASFAYRDRTSYMAGDTSGDGKIDSIANFWLDLRREGFFITGKKTLASGPAHVLGGDIIVLAPNAQFFEARNFICATNITNQTAERMDTLLDDGIASLGYIRSTTEDILTGTASPTVYDQSETKTAVCKVL
jgi:prepilin-type N-terminal cleavage/methylation domain-containing protein